MSNNAILAVSGLLLFAYLLDVVGRRLRLPSVVLLIVTGIGLRLLLDRTGLHLSWVDPVVPVIGTVGLILIVLEGALDLEVTRSRASLIVASALSSALGFLAALAGIAVLLVAGLDFSPAQATLAALPFAVISSAVAIPSAKGLAPHPREFVVYESSFSDILGVLVFYAWLAAGGSLTQFSADLVGGGAVSLVAALLAAIGLYVLINRIEGHVRFLPMLAGIVLLYAIGKALHLSPLVLVLICGLLLNNTHLLRRLPRMHTIRHPEYEQTLKEFKGLVAELTFATKSFFFLLLGYWTDLGQMAVGRAWALAAGMVVVIYATRWLLLKLLRQADAARLVWIAPRGLITVLLFLTAVETGSLDRFPFGAVMLVVLATSALTALAQRDVDSAAPETPLPSAAPVAASDPATAPRSS
ncbi:MAG: cation:proton antiporter [Betaproteobacteria bacterium]|nr:cation:proton antiporter [Betaproteobacteria bacterium]MBK8690686.1 cation:proton antiporter [Betaproteobacteria bacterium]